MIPAQSTTKGVGRPGKPLLAPTDPLLPSPVKEPALPLRGVSKGSFYLSFLPHATAPVPVKPCLNSSSVLTSGPID